MTITKAQLRRVIKTAYDLGYDDCANQSGYNIAVLSRLVNPRVARRPKHFSVQKVYELASAEIDKGLQVTGGFRSTTVERLRQASLTLGFVFLKLEDVVDDQDQKLVKQEKSTMAFNVLNS